MINILEQHLEWSNKLQRILTLNYLPVAVKFIRVDEAFQSNQEIDKNRNIAIVR